MSTTPIIKIDDFYIKREDQNPTGSAKDRAIKKQVDYFLKNEIKDVVISSTGNAAISASKYFQEAGINLKIFISPKIISQKLKLLDKDRLISCQNPISSAFRYAKQHDYYFLRISTDPIAIDGYSEISTEIIDDLPHVSSIFIPVGSGATLLGMSKKLPPSIKIFAVQPASYCPIAGIFDKCYSPETDHIVDSLGTKYLPLKNDVISILKSRGTGIVVNNKDILSTRDEYIQKDIATSLEGYMAISAYKKVSSNSVIGKYPLILFTGTIR